MSQVLVRDHQEIKAIFNNKESEDILTELILTKLAELHIEKDRNNEEPKSKNEYQPLLDSLCKLYQEDLVYLSKYRDYFLTTFSYIDPFLYFYVCLSAHY